LFFCISCLASNIDVSVSVSVGHESHESHKNHESFCPPQHQFSQKVQDCVDMASVCPAGSGWHQLTGKCIFLAQQSEMELDTATAATPAKAPKKLTTEGKALADIYRRCQTDQVIAKSCDDFLNGYKPVNTAFNGNHNKAQFKKGLQSLEINFYKTTGGKRATSGIPLKRTNPPTPAKTEFDLDEAAAPDNTPACAKPGARPTTLGCLWAGTIAGTAAAGIIFAGPEIAAAAGIAQVSPVASAFLTGAGGYLVAHGGEALLGDTITCGMSYFTKCTG